MSAKSPRPRQSAYAPSASMRGQRATSTESRSKPKSSRTGMPSARMKSAYGSARNGGGPVPSSVRRDVLAAELAVLRALHERRVEHLADVHALDLVVVRSEDGDRVLELLHRREWIHRRYRRAADDEEVVRVRRGLVLGDLEVLLEDRDRAVLVLGHARARDDRRVDIRLDNVLVLSPELALHDDPGVRGRQLLRGEVEDHVETGLDELLVLRWVVDARVDRAVKEALGAERVRAKCDDLDVLVGIDAVRLEGSARRDVRRAALVGNADLLALEVVQRLDRLLRVEQVRIDRRHVADHHEVGAPGDARESLGAAELADLDLVREKRRARLRATTDRLHVDVESALLEDALLERVPHDPVIRADVAVRRDDFLAAGHRLVRRPARRSLCLRRGGRWGCRRRRLSTARRDELSDDNARQRVADAKPESGQDERHRARQDDPSEDQRLGRAEGARNAQKRGVGVPHAGHGVDDHGEERTEVYDGDLGLPVDPEPNDEQRDEDRKSVV